MQLKVQWTVGYDFFLIAKSQKGVDHSLTLGNVVGHRLCINAELLSVKKGQINSSKFSTEMNVKKGGTKCS